MESCSVKLESDAGGHIKIDVSESASYRHYRSPDIPAPKELPVPDLREALHVFPGLISSGAEIQEPG